MNEMKYVLTLALFVTGCSTVTPKLPISGVDPAIQPYYDQFYKDSGIIPNTPIAFRELDGTYIGVCYKTSGGNYIYIDKDRWPTLSETQRLFLIYHELGHCLLYQDHRNFYLDDWCRGSIMDEYNDTDECYVKHKDYLIKELLDET